MSPIRLIVGYVYPWPNDAGFFVARERGWYRDAGLEVEITTADHGRGDTLSYLSRGEADFGVFPSNRLLVRRARHERLVGVAAINHTGLETIQALRRSGISRPRDLEGRRIAYGPTPRGRAMVSYLVALDGGDPSRVTTVDSKSHELTPEYLIESGADALFGGYWCWDVLSSSVPDDELVTWPVSEIGAPAYHSYLLGTTEWNVETNPEMVREFLAATRRGFLAAAGEKEATVDLLERVIPYQPKDRLALSLELVSTSWFHDGQWGVQREDELVVPYARWLADHGALEDADAWKGATTNLLLPRTAGERPGWQVKEEQ